MFDNSAATTALVLTDDGVESALATGPLWANEIGGPDANPGDNSQAYAVRVEVQGNVARARMWPVAGAEPSTWLVEATDARISAMAPGVLFISATHEAGNNHNAIVDDVVLEPPARLRVLAEGQLVASLPSVLPTCAGRCVFLDGDVGRAAACSIYAARPDACRAFEAGSAMCLKARAACGLPA